MRQTIAVLAEGAVVLAEDETHINLLPWVRATWIVRGTRQQVMTPGTNRRRSIFGAIDLATGRLFYQVARKAISATFTTFLEQLLVAYPTAPVVAVICDNVIIHHSKLVQRWLTTHPRVLVLHGARATAPTTTRPSGSGHAQGVAGRLPTLTIQGRLRQVHTCFRQRTPAQMLATAPGSSPWLPTITCSTSGRLALTHGGSTASASSEGDLKTGEAPHTANQPQWRRRDKT